MGLGCPFHGKLVKFHFEDFKNNFELENKGMEMCMSNASGFNRTEFVNMISKSAYKDYLNTSNFQVSQMKCEMCLLHWVMVKTLYKKNYKLGKS